MANDGEQIIQVVNGQAGSTWQPVVGVVTLRLREHLVSRGDVPTDQSAERVIQEARRVLSQCVPPTVASAGRTGLVCGYVQSGKTASMTAVSALAKDNGYRVIIVIAGVTTKPGRAEQRPAGDAPARSCSGMDVGHADEPLVREKPA